MGAGRKIPAFARPDCHFYKVTELDPLWYKIRALGIMKIKLTGNSFANETDKGTNHLLSKMSPSVI